MTSNPSNFFPIRDAIFNTLVAERQNGRIQGVKSVGKVWLPPAGSAYPYCFVQGLGSDEEFGPTQIRNATHHYGIGLAYQSTVSLDDAFTNLYSLMDDGTTNGLEVVLRDPATFTWGQLCLYSQITSIRYSDNIKDDKLTSQGPWIAYATIAFEAFEQITIQGKVS